MSHLYQLTVSTLRVLGQCQSSPKCWRSVIKASSLLNPNLLFHNKTPRALNGSQEEGGVLALANEDWGSGAASYTDGIAVSQSWCTWVSLQSIPCY